MVIIVTGVHPGQRVACVSRRRVVCSRVDVTGCGRIAVRHFTSETRTGSSYSGGASVTDVTQPTATILLSVQGEIPVGGGGMLEESKRMFNSLRGKE